MFHIARPVPSRDGWVLVYGASFHYFFKLGVWRRVEVSQKSNVEEVKQHHYAAALPLLLARVLIISRHMDLHNVGRDAVLVGDEPVG